MHEAFQVSFGDDVETHVTDEAPHKAPELQQYQQYKCLSGGSSNSGNQEEDQQRKDSSEDDQPAQHQQRRQLQQQDSSASQQMFHIGDSLLVEAKKKEYQQMLQQKLKPHEPSLSGGQGKSIGSVLHPDHCTPCSFFCYSLMGCNRGRECEYCHEDHPKKARRRGKKKRKAKQGATDGDAEGSVTAEVPSEAWGGYPTEEQDSDQAPEEMGKKQWGQTWSQNQDIDISTDANVDVPMRPAPTPDPLVPLMRALEFLAPLPTLPPTPTQVMVRHQDRCMDSWHQDQYHIPSDSQDVGFPPPSKLSLWYHESTISLEVADEKHLIPFLKCNAQLEGQELEPLLFSVHPELPEGLHLDIASGVIQGIPTRPTPTIRRHTVVAENSALSISTAIDILVRPAGFWTCGTDNFP